MGKLSEQLRVALRPGPTDCEGLIVKVVRLENENYPGRGAHGVLPVLVVGHEALTDAEWREWVSSNAVASYGAAYASKLAREGVDLKDMLPTAPMGRQMRKPYGSQSDYAYLDKAGYILTLVEQWPPLYNVISEDMAEQRMTLCEFVQRIQGLPSPVEVGQGRYTTLGDLISRVVTVTPQF